MSKSIKEWDLAADSIEFDPMRPYRYGLSLKGIKRIPKNSKILEVGCGQGTGLHFLKKMGFKNLYGIEVSNERIKRAKKNVGANVFLKVYDGNKIPFSDEYFDFIFSLAVIEHVSEPLLFLKEIQRVSKKKAQIVISSDCYTWKLLQKVGFYKSVQPIDSTFSIKGFMRIFKDAGLKLNNFITFNHPLRKNILFDLIGAKMGLKPKIDLIKIDFENEYSLFLHNLNEIKSESNFLNMIRNYVDDENIFYLTKK